MGKEIQEKDARFLENPFTENMKIQTKKQTVFLGKNNDVLINQETGEYTATRITTYKQVDSEQFVKLFTANIALTFDLTSAGIKALTVVVWAVQTNGFNKDIININQYDIDGFNLCNSKTVTLKTFYRGMRELIKAKIIARHKANNTYFTNPNFIFNGNRIIFSNIIEQKKVIEGIHPNQAQIEF